MFIYFYLGEHNILKEKVLLTTDFIANTSVNSELNCHFLKYFLKSPS